MVGSFESNIFLGKAMLHMGGGTNQLCCTLSTSATPLKPVDLCLLLPGWVKLSDISSKGVISYSSFLELTRCLYKVKIHQQSPIRDPQEGGA